MKTQFKTLAICFTLFMIVACNANTKKQDLALHKTVSAHPEPNKQFIKVALLLDTSNSMDGLIDQAKAQLWEIVNELSYAKCGTGKPNLEIALYEYGNDRLNGREGFIRQVLPFSDDLDEISKELFSLTTNGGSEYCGHVIQTSLNQLNWGKNPDDLKLIFIAGNEPFTQGQVNYKDASVNAKEKDITINTIFCGDYNQGVSSYWKDGAVLTHGDYMAINHNKATVHIASPYDDQILQLNIKLNKTYVAYGVHGERKRVVQAQQDANASGYSKANAVGRTVSKSSHLYKNSKWDLVDAVEAEEVVVEELDEDALPTELKGKNKEEIKAYVSKKQNERKAIQKEIQELNQKRKDFIAKEQTENTNGLENAMTKAIKTQAKKKKYTW
ncbi:VWA domain-containing protein [Hyunsoonleella sp. SJ7]|uniref:VWA domain-containing protein n=1 Tax=Hyunsoonleella aquatilis TaxID=2762758 RepID=A0A923H6G5_9FLAO|nr:VWA domain-containing protein [Hyunsoonleella aquatilis]MBC3756916.1 VWA domain-containing protein [Hyunsoonleella aquatilis]